MGPNGVVVLTPALDHDLRFDPVSEQFHGETFVAEFTIEAFRRPVLPRLAGID